MDCVIYTKPQINIVKIKNKKLLKKNIKKKDSELLKH